VSGGKSPKERGLGGLIDLCEQDQGDAIIVWHFDRFSREHPWDAIESLNRLRKADACMLDVANHFDSSTEMGQMAATYLAQGAHAYRERMRKSWATSRERSIARGAYPSQTPWGYEKGEKGKIILNPELAPSSVSSSPGGLTEPPSLTLAAGLRRTESGRLTAGASAGAIPPSPRFFGIGSISGSSGTAIT
jgi:site-specific DNA recombinase